MKVSFHGAARCVTGSKHLLETPSGKKILLDCGMFQGHGADTEVLNRHFGFSPPSVDAVILSHAHIDHCGLLPMLVKEGFSGPVYCTAGTRDLAEIMLLDSADIQEQDIRYINKKRIRKGKPALEPLYDTDDVRALVELFVPLGYHAPTEIMNGVELTFFDTGHMVGSAAIHLRINDQDQVKTLTFSGDVGRYENSILRAPQPFPASDYLIIESTYGDRLHDTAEDTETRLLEAIRYTCVEKKGKLIIPAFSVGRTQEVLHALSNLELDKKLPDIPVFVDSPLATEATAVIQKHRSYYNAEMQAILAVDSDPFGFPNLQYTQNVEQSKALNFIEEPCVIISSSGMADAGRVKHHIKNNIEDPATTILFVGHCEASSLGGRLLSGMSEVKIFGELYSVKAEIQQIRTLSAHADARDLVTYITESEPYALKKVFLVHGEWDTMMNFRETLNKTGIKDVEIPDLHSEWVI